MAPAGGRKGARAWAAIACAEVAAPGDLLRGAYLARRQLSSASCAATRCCSRRASASRAPSTPSRRPRPREAEDLFVMQELGIIVDLLPWVPGHPPCSGGVVDGVLQHVHGALPEGALDMSADLACGFDAKARCPPARCRSPVRDGRGGHLAQQRAATGSRQLSGRSTRGWGLMATSTARGAQATVAWAKQHGDQKVGPARFCDPRTR